MIPKRLKTARARVELTQEELGILAEIDEESAKIRVCQYESGTHRPNFETICRFAKILKVPENYFYTLNDEFAEELILIYNEKYNLL
ncbi:MULTISPECIES: helix-turn-helix domain-containing protein [Proteus]|uniref:Helix-turn-helix transcriptional regulator n=2 Tax=Proteus penneri TaxID=102862 RepID=A0A0G4PZM3_9GAMM|nr:MULTISPECIES: helix-turn-helix transcriptional regulator [Proteus]MBJ2116113.1 helix-turn-helix transcriptional regulator [Proteus penneri]MCO8052004.1 helix-turn-helix domain-containing protein [Proteus penneri]NBM97269.1 XRE family transcriptional regulator [Proteus sp. G2660]QPT34340.1 helix-turn-helix transcriptional regulator [Proteus penneri]CRL59107.1 hypothetical protein BN1804_00270 [Proteus penneri]